MSLRSTFQCDNSITLLDETLLNINFSISPVPVIKLRDKSISRNGKKCFEDEEFDVKARVKLLVYMSTLQWDVSGMTSTLYRSQFESERKSNLLNNSQRNNFCWNSWNFMKTQYHDASDFKKLLKPENVSRRFRKIIRMHNRCHGKLLTYVTRWKSLAVLRYLTKHLRHQNNLTKLKLKAANQRIIGKSWTKRERMKALMTQFTSRLTRNKQNDSWRKC